MMCLCKGFTVVVSKGKERFYNYILQCLTILLASYVIYCKLNLSFTSKQNGACDLSLIATV